MYLGPQQTYVTDIFSIFQNNSITDALQGSIYASDQWIDGSI